MSRLFLYVMVLVSVSHFSCNNNDTSEISDIDPGSIWFDYQVWGEEENDSVTIKLQFRLEGETGETISIDDPAKVELDGKLIPGNSSAITGPYYEVQHPVSSFVGEHNIRFTNIDGKQYNEVFTFQPIFLKAKIPDTIKRGTIIFHLSDLIPGGQVRILMTDTAYASEGINRVDTITNGQIIITGSDLSGLANGPIQLELIREDERPVREGTREGGKIAVSYGLKREFYLMD